MGKKKQKKSKGGAKAAEAARLPKRIAGVKVPKGLRAPAGKLVEAVRDPLVMDIAAAALMAAAAGMREGRAKAAGDGKAGKKAPDIGPLLAAAAIEGVRKIAAAKSNGADKKGGSSS